MHTRLFPRVENVLLYSFVFQVHISSIRFWRRIRLPEFAEIEVRIFIDEIIVIYTQVHTLTADK